MKVFRKTGQEAVFYYISWHIELALNKIGAVF